jgi:hypothetical protein
MDNHLLTTTCSTSTPTEINQSPDYQKQKETNQVGWLLAGA